MVVGSGGGWVGWIGRWWGSKGLVGRGGGGPGVRWVGVVGVKGWVSRVGGGPGVIGVRVKGFRGQGSRGGWGLRGEGGLGVVRGSG